MTELRECPFCGGEAISGGDDGSWYAHCGHEECLGYEAIYHDFATRDEAVEAWNSRVERTCRIVHDGHGHWECDECGGSIDWDSCDDADPPSCSFCPNCGAKVIGD